MSLAEILAELPKLPEEKRDELRSRLDEYDPQFFGRSPGASKGYRIRRTRNRAGRSSDSRRATPGSETRSAMSVEFDKGSPLLRRLPVCLSAGETKARSSPPEARAETAAIIGRGGPEAIFSGHPGLRQCGT